MPKYNFLNGELIFRHYCGMGKKKSWDKVRKWAKEQGWVNPETGKLPNKMAFFKAGWKWAIRNPEITKQIAVIALDAKGWDAKRWEYEFKDKALTAYQNPKYKTALEQFKKENGIN